jgi:hypothetical protein
VIGAANQLRVLARSLAAAGDENRQEHHCRSNPEPWKLTSGHRLLAQQPRDANQSDYEIGQATGNPHDQPAELLILER